MRNPLIPVADALMAAELLADPQSADRSANQTTAP
jgi:hypothetical protein